MRIVRLLGFLLACIGAWAYVPLVHAAACTDSGGVCQAGLTSQCPSGYKWAATPLSGCGYTEKCCVPDVSCTAIKDAQCLVGVLCPSGYSQSPGLPGSSGCEFGSVCCVPEGQKAIPASSGQAFNQDASKAAIEARNARNAFSNGLCFLPSECAEVGGTFEPNLDECGATQGKCIAPEPTIRLSSSILGRVTSTGIRDFVSIALKYLLIAGMIAAVVMFVYAGFQYILASSFMQVGNAKETMVNATVGLLILFGAVTLLNTVNPQLTVFNRIKVYMVNKSLFSKAEWCSQFVSPTGSGELKFADAGDPAGTVKYRDATFDKVLNDTKCGSKYYPQQYSGAFCAGRKCDTAGYACVSCKGNFPECNGNTLGQACVQAAMAGVLSWSQYAAPIEVHLLAVCGGAQGATSLSVVENNVPKTVKGLLVNATKDEKGTAGYVFTSQLGDYQAAQAACNGQFRGFVMGIQYLDSCDSFRAILKKVEKASATAAVGGAAAGGFIGSVGLLAGGVGATAGIPAAFGGAAVGGSAGYAAGQVQCLSNANDVLIVTKRDCGNGGGKYFSGYADGSRTSAVETDMKRALYCGWRRLPGVDERNQPSSGDTHVFDYNSDPGLNPYWTMEEIQAAANGQRDPITCDLGLNFENASPDPEANYYRGCK